MRERGFITRPSELVLMPNASRAIRALRRAGYLAVLVTNQSAVARGLLPSEELSRIHAELVRRLRRGGSDLDAIYVCPHHPDEGQPPLRRRCRCRKPAPGLFRRALRELGLDASTSWCIGDGMRDVVAAERAGVRAILVRTGHGKSEEPRVARLHPRTPIVADLAAAARLILARPHSAGPRR